MTKAPKKKKYCFQCRGPMPPEAKGHQKYCSEECKQARDLEANATARLIVIPPRTSLKDALTILSSRMKEEEIRKYPQHAFGSPRQIVTFVGTPRKQVVTQVIPIKHGRKYKLEMHLENR